MLHKETVKGETFELLNQLMQDEQLKDFNLAGGTALALYLGHRKSIDLDLFTPNSFDAKKLENYLIDNYDFKASFLEKNTLKGTINDVKIDCITHNYPYLEQPFKTNEGIRLYSVRDIAAMKLSAIADDGTRLKDFIDIACLSTQLSLNEMLQAYGKKFPNANPIRPLKGLSFFEDINFKEPIQMINGTYKWELIEKRLQNMMKRENGLFQGLPMIEEKKNQNRSRGFKL